MNKKMLLAGLLVLTQVGSCAALPSWAMHTRINTGTAVVTSLIAALFSVIAYDNHTILKKVQRGKGDEEDGNATSDCGLIKREPELRHDAKVSKIWAFGTSAIAAGSIWLTVASYRAN